MYRSPRLARLARLARLPLALMLALSGCSEPSGGVGSSGAATARLAELERLLEPTLHTMMTEVGTRHAALWFAATYGNWPLAEYQLRALEEVLGVIGVVHPERDGVEIARLLAENTVPVVEALGETVAAQDVEAFEAAFDRLTQACNDCHVAAERSALRVRRPTLPPFTNLEFEP